MAYGIIEDGGYGGQPTQESRSVRAGGPIALINFGIGRTASDARNPLATFSVPDATTVSRQPGSFRGGSLRGLANSNTTLAFAVVPSHAAALSAAISAAGAGSILAVVKTADTAGFGSGQIAPYSAYGSGMGSSEHYPFGNGALYMGPMSATRWIDGYTPPTSLALWHVEVVTHTSGAQRFYYNGDLAVSASAAETPNFSSLTFGGMGHIALFVVWDRILTAGEVARYTGNPWVLFDPINEPVFYSLGSGATDYPVTATDALTLADSASQGFGATGVATDAATLADSAAAAMAATSVASDALTLADTASNVAALSAVASDALTLADTLNASTAGNYTATATDALTLADSASNVAALSAVASDALTLADSASNVAALSATASDALTLADTLNASATGDYVVASSDALTLADSAAAAFAAVCIATDAMTLSDATSAALSGQYAATASDALTLADAASNAAALGVTITEALTLAALVSALNSGTPVLGVRGGFAVQRQLATRRAQIQTARRRN